MTNKLENLQNAYNSILEAISEYESNNFESSRDGVIQRFEFTTELIWKYLKYKLNQDGLETKGPKDVLREAYKNGYIEQEGFIQMLDDRNLASHVYKQSLAEEIYTNIREKYVDLINEFLNSQKNIS